MAVSIKDLNPISTVEMDFCVYSSLMDFCVDSSLSDPSL